MSGVAFGQKMYTWDFAQVKGVHLDVRILNGFVALETTESDNDDVTFWGSGESDAFKSSRSVPIDKTMQDQAREGAAKLRRLLHEFHNTSRPMNAAAIPDDTDERPASPEHLQVDSSVDSPPSAKRFCFACGGQLQANAAFCSSCGQKLD